MKRTIAAIVFLLWNVNSVLAEQLATAAPVQKDDPTFAERYEGRLSGHQAQFGGFYVVGLGGYEFGHGGPAVDSPPYTFAYTITPTPADMKGAFAGAAAGYNFQTGVLLLGFEARGFYSFAQTVQKYTNASQALTFPFLAAYCSPCGSSGGINYEGPITIQYISSITNKIERDESFDVSMRLGGIVQGTLLYGRLGVGAEAIKVTQVSGII